jgi:hypothetical protein
MGTNFEYGKPKLGIKEKLDIKENFDMINSPYIDLNPNVNLNATSLKDLDDYEEQENEIINEDNIYVDPFKPLFLPTAKIATPTPIIPKKRKYFDMTLSECLTNISNSYLNIIDDLLANRYTDISDLLLKESRGFAVAILLIFLAVFFVFFTPFE